VIHLFTSKFNRAPHYQHYADDARLILDGSSEQAAFVKQTLDAFESFSGLHINFSRSTFERRSSHSQASYQRHITCFIHKYFSQPHIQVAQFYFILRERWRNISTDTVTHLTALVQLPKLVYSKATLPT
jgi:hypothetical protein